MPPSHGDFAAPAKKFLFFLSFFEKPESPRPSLESPRLRRGDSFCNHLPRGMCRAPGDILHPNADGAFPSLPCEKSTQKGASLPAESPACGKGFFVSPRLRRGETAFPPAAAPAKNHSTSGPSRSLSRLFGRWKENQSSCEGIAQKIPLDFFTYFRLRRNRSKNPPEIFTYFRLRRNRSKKSSWIFYLLPLAEEPLKKILLDFFTYFRLRRNRSRKSSWIFLLTSACGGSARPHRQC